jgi:methionyl-tRNA formyltransferase
MRILFAGTPEFAIPSLENLYKKNREILIITQPDKPRGRGLKISPSPVKEFALRNNLVFYTPSNLKDSKFIEIIKEYSPEIGIVVAFGKIIPKELIEIPKFGFINVHPSLLPKYRGPLPINWAIIRGEKKTGISVQFISERIDAGDIIYQKEIEIEEEDTAGTLTEKLKRLSGEVLIEVIEMIKNNNYERIPQNENLATYAPILKKEDCKISWDKTSEEVHNLIRGLSPAPGAFSYFKGKMIKILKSKICQDISKDKKNGEVIRVSQEGILIKTKNSGILIKELQPENRKIMSVREFLCGYKIKEGDFFE